MKSELQPFSTEDKEFLLQCKRKFTLYPESINQLWEIYLKLFGVYPNYSKVSACGNCINEVLNFCIERMNSIQEQPQLYKPKKKNG